MDEDAAAMQHKDGSKSGYMMGHSTSEAERLDQQHIFFKHVVDDQLLSPALGIAIRSGQIRRILDIGTGTGIWCSDAADELKAMNAPGPVQFVGVDIAKNPYWEHRQRTEDAHATISFQVTDLNDDTAMSKLSEQFGPFDLINSRMMISSVKTGEWPAYMKRMFDLLRPGGHVQLFEADMVNSNIGRCNDRTVAEALIITHAVYSGSGLDPEAAIKLADWLHEIGFARVRDVAHWCSPLVRQSSGTLKLDDILYGWHSKAYRVVQPIFLKLRQSPDYPHSLQKLPPQAIKNLMGANPEDLLANESEYEDFLKRHEAVLTTDRRYRTVLRTIVAQRPI